MMPCRPYRSTKTFDHSLGLSAAFRQWRADSHCRFLHGYALRIRIEFEAFSLDARNWVVDFGSMKSLRAMLEAQFDHKTVVAEDDPQLAWFREAEQRGLCQLVVVPSVGCERFAEMVYGAAEVWLEANGYAPRCRVALVEVSEHGGNSAIYTGHREN
jgi:6-pyruvoyltetrahydropterin/6-carboxytetrahydropterin synthase